MRILIVLVVALAGCASAGVKVDPAKLAAFEQGRTTYAEVTAALGRPSAESVASTGQRVLVYSHVQTSVRPETFIPYVGPFVGGADSRSATVTLMFDRNGVLERYRSTSGQTGVGMGLAAGQDASVRVEQPR